MELSQIAVHSPTRRKLTGRRTERGWLEGVNTRCLLRRCSTVAAENHSHYATEGGPVQGWLVKKSRLLSIYCGGGGETDSRGGLGDRRFPRTDQAVVVSGERLSVSVVRGREFVEYFAVFQNDHAIGPRGNARFVRHDHDRSLLVIA